MKGLVISVLIALLIFGCTQQAATPNAPQAPQAGQQGAIPPASAPQTPSAAQQQPVAPANPPQGEEPVRPADETPFVEPQQLEKDVPEPQGNEFEAIVEMQDFAFSPATLEVQKNTMVIWRNKDPMPHSATSDSGTFDTGAFQSGEEANVVFKTPGTYSYYCTVHPSMKGTIIVK